MRKAVRRLRASLWIAGICLVYWSLLYVFIFRDLYLVSGSTGFLLKTLAPFALIANLVGAGLGISSWSKGRVPAGIAILLNGVPVIGITWFVWWLFFGVKI